MAEMMKRCKLVPVSFEILLEMITEGWTTGDYVITCTKGLPKDAQFVRSWYDEMRGQALLVFYHPDFPEVDTTVYLDYFVPEFQREPRT